MIDVHELRGYDFGSHHANALASAAADEIESLRAVVTGVPSNRDELELKLSLIRGELGAVIAAWFGVGGYDEEGISKAGRCADRIWPSIEPLIAADRRRVARQALLDAADAMHDFAGRWTWGEDFLRHRAAALDTAEENSDG